MQRKWDFMIVSRIFSDICDVDETIPFEEKMICFCGDFRQCFSIVFKRFRDIIVSMCLQKLFFWDDVKILFFIINMRFQDFSLIEESRQEVAVFAKDVLNIDDAMNIDENINFAS